MSYEGVLVLPNSALWGRLRIESWRLFSLDATTVFPKRKLSNVGVRAPLYWLCGAVYLHVSSLCVTGHWSRVVCAGDLVRTAYSRRSRINCLGELFHELWGLGLSKCGGGLLSTKQRLCAVRHSMLSVLASKSKMKNPILPAVSAFLSGS